ncbi:alpha-galactosidase [Fusarium proliferatum]|nr:alpha-galactosidase [Fusarium proliferatum]
MADNPVFISWQTTSLTINFVKNEFGAICLYEILPLNHRHQKSASPLFASSELPLVSVRLNGEGNTYEKTAKSLVGGEDERAGISVTAHLSVYRDVPVLRSEVTIRNESKSSDVIVTQISSLTIGGLTTRSNEWNKNYALRTATNSWFREAQWRKHSLPDIGIDKNGICELHDGHSGSQATYGLQNRGSFSTGSYLPMGILESESNSDTWAWQIEHNGSWRWEIGDYKDSVYIAAGGPTKADHDWRNTLCPGDSFTSPPVSLTRVSGCFQDAIRALNDYRRRIIRPHDDNKRLPIIFNDYMNCLMGDPDEDKIEALLDPVAQSGAEYFVIDAGWYADDSNWWDDVGLWEPSKRRFPSGFKTLMDKIKSKGLIPGLWLEPEVVGVRSVVGERLPEDAFFHENGQRVVERGRFQLDYRHPEVRAWMTSVVDRLVVHYGAGFFKFDYNIEVIQGTDAPGPSSAGANQLLHQRCYLDWVRSLLDKHPNLVIENCSSGAQRMDYAMLSVHSLQSTSDQQDPILYAAIAAALPTCVLPEQSASWAYPQPEWSDELNVFTVVNSLLGRVYLSGRLDRLSPSQMELIIEGMDVYKTIRQHLVTAHAIWPLGLPRWHDEWISLGLETDNGLYLSVWRRGGSCSMEIPLPRFAGSRNVQVNVLYPKRLPTQAIWNEEHDILELKFPETRTSGDADSLRSNHPGAMSYCMNYNIKMGFTHIKFSLIFVHVLTFLLFTDWALDRLHGFYEKDCPPKKCSLVRSLIKKKSLAILAAFLALVPMAFGFADLVRFYKGLRDRYSPEGGLPWSFGQVTAVAVWLPVVCKFLHYCESCPLILFLPYAVADLSCIGVVKDGVQARIDKDEYVVSRRETAISELKSSEEHGLDNVSLIRPAVPGSKVEAEPIEMRVSLDASAESLLMRPHAGWSPDMETP